MKSIKTILGAALCLICADAAAGGLVTNTNQNPVFFRQPAQAAAVGVQGAYYNPAGLALMEEGWHFYVGNQVAIQSRQITSTYAPFALGSGNGGSQTKVYEGNTVAPVIPNIDAAYTHGRWAASFHFGVISGGGDCTFEDGLGSFEAPMALLPAAANQLSQASMLSGYDVNINFTGKSYGFGGQLNFAYKVIDTDAHKLSVAAGVRMNYLKNDYSGGIYDYQLGYAGQLMPASQVLSGVLAYLGVPSAQAQAYAAALGSDKEVSCTQKDIAWTPILSVHYRTGIVDLAVKYEFNTKVRMTNSTSLNTANIAQFADGAEVASDIPALLSAGVGVSVLPVLRLSASGNVFFDKNANYNGRESLISRNTLEGQFGAEWDICRHFTISAGVQGTRFGLGDNNEYMTDMSFSCSNWCIGGGGRVNINEHFGIDFSVFNTFYTTQTRTYDDYGSAGATYQSSLKGLLPESALSQLAVKGQDDFYRTSLSFGLGLVMKF